MIENIKKPLVSIIVTSYNQSNFILDALESVKKQTYNNLELIIAENGSNDNSLEICKSWVAKNSTRFVSCMVLESKSNIGITANLNRGVKASNGKWLKILYGDDILLENCITDFMDFSLQNPNAKIIFGKMKLLNHTKNTLIELPIPSFFFESFDKQYEMVYLGSGLQAPAYIINKPFLQKISYFDERYPFLDDVPLYIKIAEAKEKFYYMNKFVVIYRRHNSNITATKFNFINIKLYESQKRLFYDKIIPFDKKNKKFLHLIHIYNYLIITNIIIKLGNKSNLLSRFLGLFILRGTINRIKNKIVKLLTK